MEKNKYNVTSVAQIKNIALYDVKNDKRHFSRVGVMCIEFDNKTTNIIDLKNKRDTTNDPNIELMIFQEISKVKMIFNVNKAT